MQRDFFYRVSDKIETKKAPLTNSNGALMYAKL